MNRRAASSTARARPISASRAVTASASAGVAGVSTIRPGGTIISGHSAGGEDAARREQAAWHAGNGEFGRFLYGRDCKGSQMRATMKFAVFCVSLLIAAHADAVERRNQMNALDFQERGARLRLELERAYQDLRH